MNAGRCRIFLLLLAVSAPVFSGGKADVSVQPLYPEWRICVTEPTTANLPASMALAGNTVNKTLMERLTAMEWTLRGGTEYDYYWTVAWHKARADIAKQIAERRDRRDKLIFTGDTDWRVSRQQKQIDGEIEELQAKYDTAELSSPDIAKAPRFYLSQDNINGVFPKKPEAGKELALCASQKVDALLMGNISNYHGRILVELELWTIWTRSVSYKDKALFSIEDIELALDEFSARLINSVSGLRPSALVVRTQPENALIIVNEHSAGRGMSEEIDRTPGPVPLTVFADDYVTANETITLTEGDLTDVNIKLRPIPKESFTVTTEDGSVAKVYSGGRFAGNTPLTLSGPLYRNQQINIESDPGGKTSHKIFSIEEPNQQLNFKLEIPPEEGRTEKSRSGFYGAMGRLWLAAPLAFIAHGFYNNTADTWRVTSNRTEEKYNELQFWNYARYAGYGLLGAAALEMFIKLGIYLFKGSREGSVINTKAPPPLPPPPAPEEPVEAGYEEGTADEYTEDGLYDENGEYIENEEYPEGAYYDDTGTVE